MTHDRVRNAAQDSLVAGIMLARANIRHNRFPFDGVGFDLWNRVFDALVEVWPHEHAIGHAEYNANIGNHEMADAWIMRIRRTQLHDDVMGGVSDVSG